jgi:hypothetical protein
MRTTRERLEEAGSEKEPTSRLPTRVGTALRAPATAIRSLRREPSVEGLSPEAALNASFNFRMGVLNGIMFTLVEALIAPSLVLALFVTRLGAPNVLVGLLPAILSGGWFLPQLLVASRVAGLSYVMPWYRRVGILRAICMATLALCTVLFAGSNLLLLVTFLLFYIVYSFSAGFSGIPWLEIVGKTVAPRRRGTFFGLRNFWGGIVALLAAGPLAAILSEQLLGLRFPYNFAFLFAATAVGVGVGVWAWSSIREPAGVAAEPAHSVRDMVRRGVGAFRSDVDFRAFLWARVLISLATVAEPFYVVYVTMELGAPPSIVGLFVGALSLSALLSNFLWSPLADRASNRTLMLLTAVAFALVPLLALVLTFLAGSLDRGVLYSLFAGVFVLSGLALGASRVVNTNMLLAIAPPAERAAYIGFLNTILGIVIFVPVLGGLLVDLAGFVPIFVLSLTMSLGAMLLSRRMTK